MARWQAGREARRGSERVLLVVVLVLVLVLLPLPGAGFMLLLPPSTPLARCAEKAAPWQRIPTAVAAAVPSGARSLRHGRRARGTGRLRAWEEDNGEDGVKEEERIGPGAPEGYWNDVENIKRELQVFFTVREAEEQRLLAQKKSNPLRAYLGLSDAEQTRIQKRDALIDRDLYSDLRRHGFEYLVLPIMEQGGFRVFQAMFSEGGDAPPRGKEEGGLALGRALEEKLSALSDSIASSPTAAATATNDAAVPASQGERLSYMQDDAVALDPGAWRKATKKASGGGEEVREGPPVDWSLSNPMKLYMAGGALLLAVGFGKATGGAVERGLLTPQALDSIRLAAEGALVANVLSAPLSFLLLAQAGRPLGAVVLPLALKAVVAGPAALLEYRLTGQFEREAEDGVRKVG